MATIADGEQAKAAILLIVGEPFSDGDKTLILEEIVKGFKGWDCEGSGVDINDELAQIANRAILGDEGPNGERIIRNQSENMVAEILVNPQSQTVKDSLKTILTQPCPVKAVIYAGYAFQGTAAWVVQDELFSFATFNQIFKDSNVENALKQVEGSPTLLLHTTSPNDWSAALKGSDVERLLKVSVNPKEKVDNCHGLVQFSAYINNFIRPVPLNSMLRSSDVVGNISFSRPVLYIFPAHQGDSALFGMKGFNMLVNGGYSRRACFWDFVCHLDGIDALLVTHLGPDNLFGVRAALERKASENIHPSIDYMYMNGGKATNGVKAVTNGDGGMSPDGGDLVINLAAEGSRLLEMSRKLGTHPHPLTRPPSTGHLEPVNLYHKVGQGSLDMYVLNPVGDAKEMKEFLTQWGKQAPSFSLTNGIPVPNCSSICALLVVRPANPAEKVTRILFPGNAPQHKLLEGLERVKHLEFLKHSTYCANDSHKPKKAASSPAVGNGRAGSATRKVTSATTTNNTRSATKAEPPRRLETKSSPAARLFSHPTASSAKAAKLQKDTNNKRASSAKEKAKADEKEKEDRSKSSASSSPSKASVKTASPTKTPTSPTKTPTPTKSPAKTAAPAVSPEENLTVTPPAVAPPSPQLEIESPPAAAESNDQPPAMPPSPQDNHTDQSTFNVSKEEVPETLEELIPMADNHMAADSPDTVPEIEPERSGSGVATGLEQQAAADDIAAMTEREKLREMGIFDDEDDEGVDDGFDDKENGGMFRPSGSPEPDEEEQPQSLPEPVAAAESPMMEPDLIQDTFAKPNAMEQSGIFEDGFGADYSAQAGDGPSPIAEDPAPVQEPFEIHSAAPTETAYFKPEEEESFKHGEEEESFKHGEEEDDFKPEEEEDEPAPVPAAMSDFPHSPETLREEDSKSFGFNENLKDPDPGLPTPDPNASSDKEPSPDPQEQGSGDDVQHKDAIPSLEEPDFAEEEDSNHAIEQNIQYGVANDSGFQMGGIREEEEEEAEREEIRDYGREREEEEEDEEGAKEEMDKGERMEMCGREDEEREDLGLMGQSEEARKQAMEEMGIYDDDEEAAEADDKDAYVYEKDVNLEDEEVRMMGDTHRGEEVDREDELDQQAERDAQNFEADQEFEADQDFEAERGGARDFQAERGGGAQDFEAEHEQETTSNIPEAFEKDETPTPVGKQQQEVMTAADPEHFQADSGREDTDSIDGGTPDDDKDIDEILAMKQQQQAQLLDQKNIENDDLEKMMGEEQDEESQNLNPFIGLGTQGHVMAPETQDFPPSRGVESTAYEDDDLDQVGGGHKTDSSAEFDPLSQWGPPTGLPAPAPPQEFRQEGDILTQQTCADEQVPMASTGDQAPTAAFEVDEEETISQHHYVEDHTTQPVSGQDLAFHGLGSTTMDGPVDRGFAQDLADADTADKSSDADPTEFDPLAEWGQPMGLPSPPPPEADAKSSSTSKKQDPKKSAAAPMKSKSATDKRPASAAKASATSKSMNGTAEPPKSGRTKPEPKKAGLDISRTARPASGRTLDTSRTETKTRTTTSASSTARKQAGSATKRVSPEVTKMAPLPPFTPYHVDLTYIPNHGDLQYLDTEFFKRIRARYYVLSARHPNPKVLEMLMDAKATWDKGSEAEVTVIPTYETPILSHWMAVHKEKLSENRIDIAPSASRCTVRLQDHEDSCYTYRLEF